MPSEDSEKARRNRHFGTEFLKLWSESGTLNRLSLLLGGHQKTLTSKPIPEGLPVPPHHERKSIRDQIGLAIARHSTSPLQPISFWLKLIPIARTYQTRRSQQFKRAKWDIGLPNDPLVIGDVPAEQLTVMLNVRKSDLNTALENLKDLGDQANSHPFQAPLLYISGMTYRDVPSGYGVRTETILSGLQANDIGTRLCHMAFNQANPDPDKNLIANLGEDTSLEEMFETAVELIISEANTHNTATLASGSNWMAGLCTLRAAHRLNCPFIYDVRGLWPMTRAAVEPEYAAQPAYALQMKLEWAVMRAADAVVVISDALRKLAIENGVAPEKISVVPNMTSDADQASLSSEKSRDVWTLGHAGSLTPYEGLDVILHMMARFKDIGGKPLKFWIAGAGTHKAALETLARELGLSDRVSFLGRISKEHVRIHIQASDVMVYPRQNSPVFQLVPALKPVEAMQTGTLTLLSDLAPHKGLAGEDRAGLAPAPNPADWANIDVIDSWYEALSALLGAPDDEKTQMAASAQDWCLRHRTPELALQPWLDLFREPRA